MKMETPLTGANSMNNSLSRVDWRKKDSMGPMTNYECSAQMFLLEEDILREESNVINENEDRHLNRGEMICRMQSISKIKNIIPKQTFKTAISFGDKLSSKT